MRKYIPHVIIWLLLIASVVQWFDRRGLSDTVATEKQKNKTLVESNEILDKEITDLKLIETSLQDSISGLNIQIAHGKELIEQIKKERDEKIKIIERYTVSDMQQYFNQRYGSTKK